MNTDEQETPLEEQLVAKLREWFRRSAPKTRDYAVPEITFRLDEACADDDGTLCLQARTEEKTYHDDVNGPVPGEKLR